MEGTDRQAALIASGDQAIGRLRRELMEKSRRATFRGEPAMKMSAAAVADLMDAYLHLRGRAEPGRA
jgi:hypothetical protein